MVTAKMAKRRKHEEEEAAEGGYAGMERWLLTYSDMITLLLALFIILFSMSSISLAKFVQFRQGIVNAFSHVIAPSTNASGSGLLRNNSLVNHPAATNHTHSATTHPVTHNVVPPVTQAAEPGQQPLSQISSALEKALQAAGLSSDVQMVPERRGVVVRVLADKVFYAVDHASLGPVGKQVVGVMATVLKQDTNNIVVEGYTDNQPIYGGPYSTNWELSAMRAVNVVLQLRADGINENRLAATGYGKTHPIAPNDTPSGQPYPPGQAENRRIDVVILAPGQTRL